MRNALKSLCRMKFLAFLIILQLSLGLSMLNSTTALIQDTTTKKQNFDRLFDFKRTYIVRIAPSKNEEINPQSIDSLKKYISSNKFYSNFEEFKKLGLIDSYSILFPTFLQIDDLDKFIPEEFRTANEKTMIHRAKIIVNEDFIKRKGINIIKGRELTSNDFTGNNDTIPILIGNAYKNNIEIGTILPVSLITSIENEKINLKEINFKVVGIMEHNSLPSIITKSNYMENIVYSDYSVVIPSIESIFDLSAGIALVDQGAYIETNNIENLINTLNSELKDINMTTDIISLKDDYEGILEDLTRNIMNSVTLGSTLTFLSIIGITAVLLGELKRRKKEFGVRLASGATIKILCKEITYEIMFMMIFSSILSLLINWISTIGKDNFINIYLILSNILIISILTFIISIIPVLQLRKMTIIELVRGK